MLKLRLQALAKWLKSQDNFIIDTEHAGQIERMINQAQEEICFRIGDMLEEILLMDDEQIDNELK